MLSTHIAERALPQDGFTLIELMVAVSLIGIALVGVMGSLDSGARLTLEAQRHEQAISVAQKEIEALRAHHYDELAMKCAPSHQDDGNEPGDPHEDYPRNPNYWVQGDPGTHLRIVADYGDEASGPPAEGSVASEPLVVIESGDDCQVIPDDPDDPSGVEPGPEPEEVVESDGSVWLFDVWRYVTCREEDGAGDCESKRVTVAVLPQAIANGAGPIRPFYLSTVIPRPADEGSVGWSP